jgi:crotonobetainyl-CoA:carnitine CoA-transferase CaiB-like acyl-CoA transferase
MAGAPRTTLAGTHAGLRVLDLSENIAGPLACMILADLGADVVKVERPGVGEATRSLPPRWGPESTVFLTVNRNKRSVALDLGTPAGRDAVLRLGAGSDVVVESFRPGVAERLGLGFEDFRAANPTVVHCSISAFGTGPLGHDRPGYDAIVQAFTGIMEMTGDPDGLPARAAPSVVDVSTGLWALISIQAALARRPTEPGAQRVGATLVDSGMFLLGHQVMGYLGTGEFPGRLGSAAPSTAPYQAFRTADGAIMIAGATDRLFERMCRALDLPNALTDPRFATVADRVAARDELTAVIEARLRTAPSAHWLDLISAAGVPAGPVNDLAQALSHPVTRERALIRDAEPGPGSGSGSGEARIPGLQQLRLPIDTEGDCAMREPPALGHHTAEVLAEAGLDPAEIDELILASTHATTQASTHTTTEEATVRTP